MIRERKQLFHQNTNEWIAVVIYLCVALNAKIPVLRPFRAKKGLEIRRYGYGRKRANKRPELALFVELKGRRSISATV